MKKVVLYLQLVFICGLPLRPRSALAQTQPAGQPAGQAGGQPAGQPAGGAAAGGQDDGPWFEDGTGNEYNPSGQSRPVAPPGGNWDAAAIAAAFGRGALPGAATGNPTVAALGGSITAALEIARQAGAFNAA